MPGPKNCAKNYEPWSESNPRLALEMLTVQPSLDKNVYWAPTVLGIVIGTKATVVSGTSQLPSLKEIVFQFQNRLKKSSEGSLEIEENDDVIESYQHG